MDKQIIIDGVDVTDCEYCSRYGNTTIYHCGWIGECKEHPNCHYKQLKCKEQELEQYKKSKQASYEALQKKCNELELGIRKLQKQFGIEILYCKATGESTFRSTEILKLKQTLIEIKEYCTDMKKDHYWGMRMMRFANEVLQKISEVLDE